MNFGSKAQVSTPKVLTTLLSRDVHHKICMYLKKPKHSLFKFWFNVPMIFQSLPYCTPKIQPFLAPGTKDIHKTDVAVSLGQAPNQNPFLTM